MIVIRSVVERLGGVVATVADRVVSGEPERSFPSFECVALSGRGDCRRIENGAKPVAYVAVEVIVVRGGLREERPNLRIDPLVDRRRNGLVELFVRR